MTKDGIKCSFYLHPDLHNLRDTTEMGIKRKTKII